MARQKSTHVDDPAAVGERIRSLRRACGLRQTDISFPGCTTAYISRIESGARIPSLQLLREIGRRLGTTADYLATGTTGSVTADDVLMLDAELAHRLGEHDAAQLAYEALAASEGPAARRHALDGLGRLALRRGAAREAIRLLEDHDRLQSGLGVDATAAEALARAYVSAGDAPAAISLLEAKLEAAGDNVTRSRLRLALAGVLADLDDVDRAEPLAAAVVAGGGSTPGPEVVARTLWSESRSLAARGDLDTAASYAEQALAIMRAVEQHADAALAYELLAQIALRRGRADEALDLLDRALPLVAHAGDSHRTAIFSLVRGRALADAGRLEEARSLARDATVDITAMSPADGAKALRALADLQASTGNVDRALRTYEAAVGQLAGRVSDATLTDLYRRWSDTLAESGDTEQALAVARRALEPTRAPAGGGTRP